MSVQPHILLAERKALAARLVQIEATLPLGHQFRAQSVEIAFENLDRKLKDIFHLERSQLKDDKVPLDQVLSVCLERLRLSAEVDLLDKTQLAHDLRIALEARAGMVKCADCTQLSTICNGGRKDNIIVSAGGACLAPLRQMFEFAETTARHYYSTIGTQMQGDPEVVFASEAWPVPEEPGVPALKPHDFPVEYYVNGLTSYEDSASQTLARVSLIIPAEMFNTVTYLSTCYVLFHECLVHAFHALNPRVIRVGPKPQDRFIEGWMDWISYKVLAQVLEGVGEVSPPPLRFLNLRREHAQDFHKARVRYWDPAPATLARDRYAGKNVAKKVFAVFKSRPDLCRDPWREFLRTSFDLNMMSSFDNDQREAFVRLFNFLDDDPLDPPSPRHNILTGIISNYLRYKNLPGLVDQVLALKPQWLPRVVARL